MEKFIILILFTISSFISFCSGTIIQAVYNPNCSENNQRTIEWKDPSMGDRSISDFPVYIDNKIDYKKLDIKSNSFKNGIIIKWTRKK